MFKRLVMLVRGLMGCLSMGRSTYQEVQLSASVKPLRVKSTQTLKAAQEPKPQRQSPSRARPRLSKETKAAPLTKAASKDTSKKPKPVQTGKQPSSRGKTTPTPVSKTHQHVKPKAKLKP